MRLVQDAEIWAAKLDADVEAIHTLAPGRRAWLQVAKGEVSVGERNAEGRRRRGDDRPGARSLCARATPAKCCCSIWRDVRPSVFLARALRESAHQRLRRAGDSCDGYFTNPKRDL